MRGIGSALFRRAPVGEHQQQIATAIQRSGRHCTNDRKRLAGVVNHFLDRRHRVTGRETLPKARTDQQVAFLDVCSVRHMPKLQTLRVTGAAGDGTQTVAVDLHRDAVGGVSQQQDA